MPPNSYGYTSDIWIQDDEDGTYWPEAWLDTHADGIPPGLPNCSELSQPSVTTPNLFYNRRGAADWALANAPHDPAASYFGVSTCTWFVSNALWAGGFPRDAIWTDQGEHNRVRKVPGSVTAWSVVDLKQYLETHYSLTEVALGADRLRANAVPEAEIGDLIVYDWGEGEGWSHFTIVTNIAPGEYPEVSEWGVDASYTKRGWTYSENKDRYLQWIHPNVKAVLLHIDGGVLLPGF